MALDSDISNSDSHLHVEFYENDREPYEGVPFVRIMIPGDKTTEIDQPVREDHKERFPRQWLYYQMKNSDGSLIGTPLEVWHKAAPEEFNDRQMAELQILKFQTVEQVATALQNYGGIAYWWWNCYGWLPCYCWWTINRATNVFLAWSKHNGNITSKKTCGGASHI